MESVMRNLASQYSCDNLYQVAIKLGLEWGLIQNVFSPLPEGFLEALEVVEEQKQISLRELQARFQSQN